MTAYIIRRLLLVVPIALGVMLVTFFLFHVVAVNPAYRIAGKNSTPEKIAQISHERGYDKPLFLNFTASDVANFQPLKLLDAQFPRVCWQTIRFDFGESQTTKQRVNTMLGEGILPSLCVTVPIFVLSLVLAIALSLLAAYSRDSWLDRSLVVVSVTGMSVSSLVYILVAQYWLAGKWGIFPIWGFESVKYLLLPVLIGVIAGIGGELRFFRTIMLDEVNQEYVRAARAKGVSDHFILFRHVLRNAMIPILTSVVVEIPFLYTGALLFESFFGIPGLGRMGVIAIQNSDENVLFAITYIGSILFVIANVMTDIAYTWADPRIRLK